MDIETVALYCIGNIGENKKQFENYNTFAINEHNLNGGVACVRLLFKTKLT